MLHQAIEQALHRRALLTEQRAVERAIRDEVAAATSDLERDQLALRGVSVEVAEALVTAMEAKDLFLRGASQRMADLASSIAVELRLDEDTTEAVRLAGRLHDVGMIGIRESVLHKPGRLTPEEYAHVQEHVRIGLDILAPLRHLRETLRFVGDHHERFDGTGYPGGLAGDEISIGGRILAAADAYEAITSKRSYQRADGARRRRRVPGQPRRHAARSGGVRGAADGRGARAGVEVHRVRVQRVAALTRRPRGRFRVRSSAIAALIARSSQILGSNTPGSSGTFARTSSYSSNRMRVFPT